MIACSAEGRVKELFVKPGEVEIARAKAEKLDSVELSTIDLQWLQVLSEGWASPLAGI